MLTFLTFKVTSIRLSESKCRIRSVQQLIKYPLFPIWWPIRMSYLKVISNRNSSHRWKGSQPFRMFDKIKLVKYAKIYQPIAKTMILQICGAYQLSSKLIKKNAQKYLIIKTGQLHRLITTKCSVHQMFLNSIKPTKIRLIMLKSCQDRPKMLTKLPLKKNWQLKRRYCLL